MSSTEFTGKLCGLFENIEALTRTERPMNDGEWLIISGQLQELYKFNKYIANVPTTGTEATDDENTINIDIQEMELADGNLYWVVKDLDQMLNNILLRPDTREIVGRLFDGQIIDLSAYELSCASQVF
jgi:hypothetical protein